MRTNLRWRTTNLFAIAFVFVCCLGALSNERSSDLEEKVAASTQRIKVAQGEYVVFEGANGSAVGPFGEEVYNFHETWTLWRTVKGEYELEGERRFESPRDVTHTNRFQAQLSRDLTLTSVTELARLRWKSDSGPLTCEFQRSELDCSSNASDSQQALNLKMPMTQPFGLVWPISAFSLSGITREAERDPSQPTRVQLISIEQPSAQIPVNPMILDGELRYLGEENFVVAGQPRLAFKFSIKFAFSPELIIWTTPKGLLLSVAVQHEAKNWPEESMKLIHFQEWGLN